MSISTLRIIIVVVLIAHGIGHSLGIIAGIGVKLTPNHSSKSWLLTKLLGERITGAIGVILFLAALLGFIGAGLGLMDWFVPQNIWENLALIASIFSIVGLALFPYGFPSLFPNVIGALAVDVAVLVLFSWMKWPPELFGG